jgi:hypothetical protein
MYAELRRVGFTAMQECSHVVLAGMSAGLRALLDVATDVSKACRDAARAAYAPVRRSVQPVHLQLPRPRLHGTPSIAGLSAARVYTSTPESSMRGIRPDIVANDTTNASLLLACS